MLPSSVRTGSWRPLTVWTGKSRTDQTVNIGTLRISYESECINRLRMRCYEVRFRKNFLCQPSDTWSKMREPQHVWEPHYTIWGFKFTVGITSKPNRKNVDVISDNWIVLLGWPDWVHPSQTFIRWQHCAKGSRVMVCRAHITAHRCAQPQVMTDRSRVITLQATDGPNVTFSVQKESRKGFWVVVTRWTTPPPFPCWFPQQKCLTYAQSSSVTPRVWIHIKSWEKQISMCSN